MSVVSGRKLSVMRFASVVLAATILLSPSALARRASFDMPACDRMMESAAPASAPAAAAAGSAAGTDKDATAGATTDAGTKAETTTAAAVAATGKKVMLQPLKLTDDKDSFSVGNDGKMKVEVQQNVTAQSGDGKAADPGSTKSIIDNDKKIAEKLLKDAKKVNVGPTPLLVETPEEQQQKSDLVGDAERRQLTDLWTATINRSPDIQFVINRLQPTSDPNHATATAFKLLSGALFNAVQAVPMMMGPGMNTMLMYGGVGSGASMIQTLIAGQDAKNLKKQQISQEQATMLYKIVRDTADKLVLEFRTYKKNRNDYERALNDLEDIKTMVATARNAQDAAKQIEMEYTIRKAQRDVDDMADAVRLHRQALTDLAGPDAVAKLDEQVEQETAMLKNLTGGQCIKPEPIDDSVKGPQVAGNPKTKTQ